MGEDLIAHFFSLGWVSPVLIWVGYVFFHPFRLGQVKKSEKIRKFRRV